MENWDRSSQSYQNIYETLKWYVIILENIQYQSKYVFSRSYIHTCVHVYSEMLLQCKSSKYNNTEKFLFEKYKGTN